MAWWLTPEGMEIENLYTSLGLSQIEPSNWPSYPYYRLWDPSPTKFILYSPSTLLQNTSCFASECLLLCFRIPPALPFERKNWSFNRENIAAVKWSLTGFPWLQYLNINNDTRGAELGPVCTSMCTSTDFRSCYYIVQGWQKSYCPFWVVVILPPYWIKDAAH